MRGIRVSYFNEKMRERGKEREKDGMTGVNETGKDRL